MRHLWFALLCTGLLLGLGAWTFSGLEAVPPLILQTTPGPALTPIPEATSPSQPLGYTTIMALACLFMLSVLTLAGSVALKRRFDAISPD